MFSALPAVTDDGDDRHKAEKLHAAEDEGEYDQPRGKEQKYRDGRIDRRKRGLCAEGAEIRQAHGDGKQDAHDAVIDVDARKTTDAHRQREGCKKRKGEADDFPRSRRKMLFLSASSA